MSPCDEFHELISGRLDGVLSPFEEKRLEAHLLTCPQCRELEQDLLHIRQALQDLPPMEPPAELTRRIQAAVAADSVTPLPAPKKHNPWKRWTASAAVIALAVLGVFSFHPFHPEAEKTPSQVPQAVSMEAPAEPEQPAAVAAAPVPPEEPAAAFAMEGPQPRLMEEAPQLMTPEQQILELCAEALFPDAATSYDLERKVLTVTPPAGAEVTLSCIELHPDGISTVELTRADGSSELYRTDLASEIVTAAC